MPCGFTASITKNLNQQLPSQENMLPSTNNILPNNQLQAEIKRNEKVIATLQETIEAKEQSGEDVDELIAFLEAFINKQNVLIAKQAGDNAAAPLCTGSSKSPQCLDPDLTPADSSPYPTDKEKTINLIHQELLKLGVITPEQLAKIQISEDTNLNAEDQHNGDNQVTQELNENNNEKQHDLLNGSQEAVAQYNQAMALYNKRLYKQAAASFSRVVKTYRNDPITPFALYHLALCRANDNNLEDAAIICKAIIDKDLPEDHVIECQLIRLKNASNKKHENLKNDLKEDLAKRALTPAQKSVLKAY